ncbi:MAG: SH3 domain-containing protein [Anaerolineae bacterium]|nr:SH3 domain-containing protein [Anaerolineae bacterium]
MRTVIILIAGLLLLPTVLLAQAELCPALVQAAYAAAALECADVQPGEACFGNRPLDVSALGQGSFTRPGHKITGLQTLTSGAMNPGAGEWGVAVLNVVANAPDQTLTMIVLGDVTLENASAAESPVMLANLRVVEKVGLIVRAAPEEDAEVVALLNFGDIVPATGRLEFIEWLRVALPDGGSGWVSALSVLPEGDVDALPVVSAADTPPETFYSPLQAIEFTSGAESAPCSDAPASGILIQTMQPVSVQANGVDIQLDGTVFLQAPRELSVHVLEGTAQVTSREETESAAAGWRIEVRYDTEAHILTHPRKAEQDAYVQMRPLPFELLPRGIDEPEFNLMGVTTPAAPDRPVLEGIIDDSPCTVAAGNEVRLRQGPGRDYPIVGALYAGESARPDARAEGEGDVVWWRLSPGIWVSSDVVFFGGACEDLPFVESPPLPTATP